METNSVISYSGNQVTKVITNPVIAERELKFLDLIKSKRLKNVLAPISIDYAKQSVVFPKMTSVTLLPFNILSNHSRLHIVKQLLNGIKELHSLGIIHNDIKLDNILYDPNTLNVKIIDFSTSLFIDEQTCITGGTTPLYECPEKTKSVKSDIWSFGICVLKLLGMDDSHLAKLIHMNKQSIRREIMKKMNDKKSRTLVNLALVCLEPNPKKRCLLYQFVN